MKSPGAPTRPPRTAVWLINLFTSPGQEEAILGDLHEEFSVVAARVGESAARHWYWRQCGRTLGHLVIASFRTAPVQTLGVAVAGVAMSTMLAWATGAGLAPIAVQLGLRYLFLAFFTASVLAQMLTGWTVARITPRRPMIAALSVVLAMGVFMAVTQPMAYLGLRLMVLGAPILTGAAIAAKRLRRNYEVTPAFGR